MKLLRRNENNISSSLGFPDVQCKKCQMEAKIKRKYIYQVEAGEIKSESKEITMKDIFCYMVSEICIQRMLF